MLPPLQIENQGFVFGESWRLPCFGASLVQNLPCNGFDPWVKKIPWRRKWQLTPVFLPGEFHGQRNLAGIVHSITKSQTQLSNFYFRGGVFNHSSCCGSSVLNGHSLKMMGSISGLSLLVLLVFWILKDPPPAQRCRYASYWELSFCVTRLCMAFALARVRGASYASGPLTSHIVAASHCRMQALGLAGFAGCSPWAQ